MPFASADLLDFIFGDSNKSNNEFVDGGISNNFSNDWLVLPEVTKKVTDNGTVVSCSKDAGIYANVPSTSLNWEDTFEWSTPCTIEFDVIKWEGAPYLRVIDNDTDAARGFAQIGITNGSHVKVVSNDSSVNYIVDGDLKESVSGSLNNAQIGFRLINSTIIYKDFKIY